MDTRLKELRHEKRWTQREVAERLNCCVATYGKYERGQRKIPLTTIVHLAFLYDVSVHYMLKLTDERMPLTVEE